MRLRFDMKGYFAKKFHIPIELFQETRGVIVKDGGEYIVISSRDASIEDIKRITKIQSVPRFGNDFVSMRKWCHNYNYQYVAIESTGE